MADVVARVHLRDVRDLLDDKRHALAALNDERVHEVVQAIGELQVAIVDALSAFGEPRAKST